MLQLSIAEFFMRIIPEAVMMTLAIYAFSRIKVNRKRFLIATSLCAIITFAIRCLPISYGIHTILIMLGIICIATAYNKIPVLDAIRATIISVIIQFIAEGVNVFFIQYVLRVDMEVVFNNQMLKLIYGLPSLIFGLIAVICYYTWLHKRNELKFIEY